MGVVRLVERPASRSRLSRRLGDSGAGGRLVNCALDDVDSLYERARAAAADVAVEIANTDCGSRDFTLRDPGGNLWAFGTYRPQTETHPA